MKIAIHKCAAALGPAAALLLATAAAAAQESGITNAQLPPAVQQAVLRQGAGAQVRGFAREVEHGQTFYEAELTVGGRHKDVLMDSTGTVVEIEEQVALADLPHEVRCALEAKAGAGRILNVESLTKRGRLAAYEAQVLTGTKRSEIQVGPAGGALEREQ